MSVILFRHNPEGKWPLIVGANHSENKNRVALGVKVLCQNPLVIGEQDAKHGGTWLALAKNGLMVGCINMDPLLPHDVSRLSRGAMVLALAQKESAAAAADYIAGQKLGTVNAAYFLMVDRKAAFLASVTDSAIKVDELHGNHWHILGCLGLDARQDPKTARARYLLHTTGISDHSDYIGQMKPILRDHAKPMRPAEKGQKLLVTDSICFHSNDYSTQGSTMLRVGQDDGSIEYWGSHNPLCKGHMNNYSNLLK